MIRRPRNRLRPWAYYQRGRGTALPGKPGVGDNISTMKNALLYFFTGGLVTTAIVLLEGSNQRILSGLATLMPVFTLVAYLFIGQSHGGQTVSQHAWLVLWGTIVSWIPYMITVAVLATKLGPNKAIAVGLVVFFVLALAYLAVVGKYKLFT